jgi:hypothetical protein
MIGFVDLNVILRHYLRPGMSIKDNENKPVEIHGYESCPFACAKTLLIHKMMLSACNEEAILQVWYLSTWSKETDEAFLIACQALMKEDIHKNIFEIISHWSATKAISVKEAHSNWRYSTSIGSHDCHNFKKVNDRVEMARYLLTGQLLDSSMGSRIMFEYGFMGYSKVNNENFIYSQNLFEMECRNPTSFLSNVLENIKQDIRKCRKSFIEGKIKLIIRLQEILPSDDKTLKEIHDLKPDVVYWTNLCDYFCRSDFQKMVRAISSENTFHRIHSMNWMQKVKGAEILDYNTLTRGKIIKAVEDQIVENAEVLSYHWLGIFLTSEHITNIQNPAIALLLKDFAERWVQYYFEGMLTKRIASNMLVTFIETPSLISFGFSTNFESEVSDFDD